MNHPTTSNSASSTKARPRKKLLFVFDERLSRQKTTILTRITTALRQVFDFKLLSGNIDESALVTEMEAFVPDLVLLPWYRYLAWSKVEGFYGLTRTSGPTTAGYHMGQLLPYELGEQAGHLRALLLDFAGSTTPEILTMIRSMATDTNRSGLAPLLGQRAAIYVDHWSAGQKLGAKLDAVLGLPEIALTDWASRSSAIRIVLGALWTLVFQSERDSELIRLSGPRASLQVGAGEGMLALRMSYTRPGWSPKDALERFWPRQGHPTSPDHLLLRHADFLRVHMIADTPDIEVVAGFFKTEVAERHPDEIHTLWVEPLSAATVAEPLDDEPGPEAPHLRWLPVSQAVGLEPPKPAPQGPSAEARQLATTELRLKAMREELKEKEEQLLELRAGGIGTAPDLAPPDAESLIEAFQERFFEARSQLRNFELQYGSVEKKAHVSEEIRRLREDMSLLKERQEHWIRALADLIRTYQDDRKALGKRSA